MWYKMWYVIPLTKSKNKGIRYDRLAIEPGAVADLQLISPAKYYGEMSELAEGARLEIVCAAKSGTEGSNPSLSAIYHRPAESPSRRLS